MDVEYIKTLLSLHVETCGYVNNEMVPVVDGVSGNDFRNRNICINNKYHRIIWHTHTNDMKSYPSSEDIIKILKPRNNGMPEISLIFTRWGIWKLWAGKKMVVSKDTINVLEKESDWGLYHITDKGRGRISKPFVQSYTNSLEYMLSDYQFIIELTLWEDIPSGIYRVFNV